MTEYPLEPMRLDDDDDDFKSNLIWGNGTQCIDITYIIIMKIYIYIFAQYNLFSIYSLGTRGS